MPEHIIEQHPSAYAYPLLIKSLLKASMINNPDQEIVYGEKRRHSYREFGKRIGRLANALADLGVTRGDTVAVMDWDSHRYLECYFSVPMMGAVLHHINVRLSHEQLLYTINHAEDDILLINSEFLPLYEQIKGRIDTIKKVILITDQKDHPHTSVEFVAEYEQMLSDHSSEFDFPDFDENTRATTFYTTGTTGLPKGVYFSHRQLVLHTLGTMAAGGMTKESRVHGGDVYMPMTPMFHVHAWGTPYFATVLGIKQVYPGRYNPEELLSLIVKEKVTYSHCVPTILHMVLSHPKAQDVDWTGMKIIIGGSALTKAQCKSALALGIDIWSGYGMSESCPLISLASPTPGMEDLDLDEQIEYRCKSGRAVPLVDLRVVDEEMIEVPHDGKTAGEVVVRAPWLTQGYFKDSRNSEQLWRGGYLHTGDVATIDSQGWIQICDRIKDVIKTGGEWISSLALEDIICEHPEVSEVAVIGVPDEKWGERPMAIVVGSSDLETIKNHVENYAKSGVISRWGIPDQVLFVESLEKTSVGKIDKKVLRQKYLKNL